jgi:hypothetical protein
MNALLRAALTALVVSAMFWSSPTFAASSSAADEEPHAVRFIDLGPLSAAIVNRNRVRGLVTVQITVEILKPDAASETQSKLPRVQAAWLNVYQRHIGRLSGPSERLDLESMIGDMRQASDIVIGKGAIRPLIQNIQYSR